MRRHEINTCRMNDINIPTQRQPLRNCWQSKMQHFTIDPDDVQPPTRDLPSPAKVASSLPDAKEVKTLPTGGGGENGSLYFVGTATTILCVLSLLLFPN